MPDSLNPEKFRRNAHHFLEAAKLISEANTNDQLLAPCCHNIGIAIELYLKSILIDDGLHSQLRSYGHDIKEMWQAQWAQRVTTFAYEAAPSCMGRILASPGVPANPNNLLAPSDELDRNIQWLSEGYSRDSDYALRYPPNDQLTVPAPEFLIAVLDHMFDFGP